MNWLYLASLLSAVTLVIHVFGGGITVARPLLESNLGAEAKYTNYYCWHMVTIIIAAMAICFFLSARAMASVDVALLSSVLALAFAVWSGALTIIKKQHVLILPQWILFLPIAITGFIGSL